jgi:methylglyoxal synthase
LEVSRLFASFEKTRPIFEASPAKLPILAPSLFNQKGVPHFYLFMTKTKEIRQLNARKRIALVAHDNKKKELIEWAFYNKATLTRHELFGTGTTGKLLEDALDVPVKRLLSGPLGGDQQIGSMIAEGKIDVLVFFWDPMEAQPHDTDIKALLRLGVTWNIPIACDRASADFMLTSPLMVQEYEIILPDYSGYLNRLRQGK